jgi:hypothetical protein
MVLGSDILLEIVSDLSMRQVTLLVQVCIEKVIYLCADRSESEVDVEHAMGCF